MPLLRAGYLVLCDRYIFTAFARDVVRGCPPEWVRGIYSFAALPDLTFFFKADLEVSLQRILDGRPQLKYFEAGMDLRLSTDPYESFRIFQGRILEQYLAMSTEFNFLRHRRQPAASRRSRPSCASWWPPRIDLADVSRAEPLSCPAMPTPRITRTNPRPPRRPTRREQAASSCPRPAPSASTGTAFPAWTSEKLTGKLIVVEGADGSGRSTQIPGWWSGWKAAATPPCRWA